MFLSMEDRDNMNARERFLRTLRFQEVDRVFLLPQWLWGETVQRWHKEGMPEDVHINEFFGFDRYEVVPINMGVIPLFEEKILEEDSEYKTYITSYGAKIRERRDNPELSMPEWLEYPIKDRKDWEEYKKRLNPDSPMRYPEWWEDYKKSVKGRTYPLGINAGSFFGWQRNWMGLEKFSCTLYDDPGLVHDMCDYTADFAIKVIKRAVEEIELDFALIWEDMAMKNGPLISPKLFREFMMPNYKKVTDFLRAHGIDIILVDSDGNNDELIPLWLEVGVNGLYPLEVAADTDAVALRKKYGKDLLLIGNIDKRELAKGKREIEKEVKEKVPYLLSQGGYIPFVDHSVPPDVSFENFTYYLEMIKKIGSA